MNRRFIFNMNHRKSKHESVINRIGPRANFANKKNGKYLS